MTYVFHETKNPVITPLTWSFNFSRGKSLMWLLRFKTDNPYLIEVINLINQGPVVQSIVSSTSSLRGQLVKYFRTL